MFSTLFHTVTETKNRRGVSLHAPIIPYLKWLFIDTLYNEQHAQAITDDTVTTLYTVDEISLLAYDSWIATTFKGTLDFKCFVNHNKVR